jgi:hypothetical protein
MDLPMTNDYSIGFPMVFDTHMSEETPEVFL